MDSCEIHCVNPDFPVSLLFLFSPLFCFHEFSLSASIFHPQSNPSLLPLCFYPLWCIDIARNARWAINELDLAQLPKRWIVVQG